MHSQINRRAIAASSLYEQGKGKHGDDAGKCREMQNMQSSVCVCVCVNWQFSVFSGLVSCQTASGFCQGPSSKLFPHGSSGLPRSDAGPDVSPGCITSGCHAYCCTVLTKSKLQFCAVSLDLLHMLDGAGDRIGCVLKQIWCDAVLLVATYCSG
ncbi:hypothetical protein B0O99DRAFT_184196 [Bisporella sp. PMI_857]|nr:hypothetical protein B0O99DRAFT_184196 [Bisporella sp. PMI_857]